MEQYDIVTSQGTTLSVSTKTQKSQHAAPQPVFIDAHVERTCLRTHTRMYMYNHAIIHAHTHNHTHMHASMHACACARTHTHTHPNAPTHTLTRAHARTHTHARTRTCTRTLQVTLLSSGRLMYTGAREGLVEWFADRGYHYEPTRHGVASDWWVQIGGARMRAAASP
jgi:hypothetical protein